MPLEKTSSEETVNGSSLESYCDALSRDARLLICNCGEFLQMETEANTTLRRFPSPGMHTFTSAGGESDDIIPVPTAPLYFAAISKLHNLLCQEKINTTSCGDCERRRVRSEQIILLCRVITLYCFATNQTSLSKGKCGEVHSQGSSGRSTPHMRLASSSSSYRHDNNTKKPNNNNNNNNNNNVEAENQGVEIRMAEETFRVAVDAVVRLSTYRPSHNGKHETIVSSSTSNSNPPTATSTGLVYSHTEVNRAVLYLLTISLIRFRNVSFNAMRYLPSLFPEVDARDHSVFHPLLTPLLWSHEECIQSAAATLMSCLLRKLQHNFKYAEEPRQNRQSFSSLASQCGRTLASLHDVLQWALQLPGGNSSSGANNVSVANVVTVSPLSFSKGTILSLFGVLVSTTPYDRCPHAFKVIQEVLKLPLLRDFLLEDTCSEFSPTATFLSYVFKTQSLSGMLSTFLSSEENDVANTGAPVNRNVIVIRHAGGAGSLLEALLTHAASRAEMWQCIVQLSRFHPSIVGSHFIILMEASLAVLQAALERACGNEENTQKEATTTTTTTTTTTVGGNTLEECLRAWLHFMGYIWRSFDGHSADPALREEDHMAHRATLEQKKQIVEELILPVFHMTSNGCQYHDARCVALRCVAQIGDEYFSSTPDITREEIVKQVISSTTAHETTVRAEGFITIGVWAWQYTSFDMWLPDFVDRSASALFNDAESLVRLKAAFALSNITSHLGEEKQEGSPLRQSPHQMQLLCDVAMYAAQSRDDPGVVSHGIRMMGHLLGGLGFEELIAELSQEQVGVAEGYFTSLLRFLLPSNRDAKLRWNAAWALGLGVSREVVFEAEPQLSTRVVERLAVLVGHDRIFKVRTQAAVALAKVPAGCMVAGRFAEVDLAPKVTKALCEALRTCGGATDTFAQYREEGALRAALRQALAAMITGAAPSGQLQRVFAEHRVLLEAEGLL